MSLHYRRIVYLGIIECVLIGSHLSIEGRAVKISPAGTKSFCAMTPMLAEKPSRLDRSEKVFLCLEHTIFPKATMRKGY